jgi:hypothetical protein
MKKSIPFIIAGAGLILFYFMSKAKAGKSLKVNFHDILFGSSSGFNIPDMYVRFQIINPSSTPITIDSIVGDVIINGNSFATISNTSKFQIPAKETILYKVKVQIGLLNVATTLYDLYRNKEKFNVTFNGSINSSGLLIPINQTIAKF